MRVFIKIDSNNRVTDVNSEIFITDISGRIEIDNGNGDRFAHAQNSYFPKPITDDNGVYRYKYENDAVCERSAEEIAADLPADVPVIPTDHDRLEALEQAFMEFVSEVV